MSKFSSSLFYDGSFIFRVEIVANESWVMRIATDTAIQLP